MTEDSLRNPLCDICSFGVSSIRRPTTICLMDAPRQADVMIVSEIPTLEDDKAGAVFASSSTRKIKEFFERKGLSVYCAYAMKCVKPEAKAKIAGPLVKPCAEQYLRHEIALVKPKHIVVLGGNALYGATKKRGITKFQGGRHFDEKLGAYIYATYHPAQAAYDRAKKEQMHAELRLYARWIAEGDNLKNFEPPVKVADTLKALLKIRRLIRESGGQAAVDIETSGLKPFDPAQYVRSIQFCWDENYGGVFVPLDMEPDCYHTSTKNTEQFWTKESLAEAVKIIRQILRETKCIWHNGKFDRVWLAAWGERRFGSPIVAPHILMDTMHAAYVINENRPLGLKKLITAELGYPTYDIPDKLTKDLDVFIPYSTNDVVATLLLARKYAVWFSEPENKKRWRLYKWLIRPMDALYTEMELEGWPVDAETARPIKAKLENRLVELDLEMRAYLTERGITPEGGDKAFTSNEHVAALLFDDLELPVSTDPRLAFSPEGGRSVDVDALLHIRKDEFVRMLMERRKLTKALSTYVLPMLQAAEKRGRITTSYKLAKTNTGRSASGKEDAKSEGMNLQNIPHVFGIETIVKAPKDCLIWSADFSQIELVIAAHESQDPLMLRAFQTGQDLHAIRAMRSNRISKEDWAELEEDRRKSLRKKAKPENFGWLYKMGAITFQTYALKSYGIEFTMKECVDNRAQYFEDHHGLLKWYARQERRASRDGYVENLIGRRRHLPDAALDKNSASGESKARRALAIRQAINAPVQAFGSDLKMMSIIEIRPKLDWERARIFGEIHDSIVGWCHKDCVMETGRIVLGVMRQPSLLAAFGVKLSVPINAEFAAGPSLGELKDIKFG